ncbi:MAG: hypothetical protein ORN21_02480 [Methylophilaceae bacterium]|nr:hypothetical protein [Methylophilaceae bacterium]
MALWKFDNSSWEQRKQDGAFVLKSFGEVAFADSPDSTMAPNEMHMGTKTHPKNSSVCSERIFPVDFDFCPDCGEKLVSLKPAPAQWIPPYGCGNGLKIIPYAVKSECFSNKGERFALPPEKGHFSFVSAYFGTKTRLLVAIERNIGQVWVYRPALQKWGKLEGDIGECSMPTWAWSLALNSAESACAMPTDKGPVWFEVDWHNNSLKIESVNDQSKSIGSPVRVGQFVLAPVMRGNQFAVLSRKDGDDRWFDCEVASGSDPTCVAPQLQRNPEQPAYCGIPVVDESRKLAYWPCRGGYIKVSNLNSTGHGRWEFRQWEYDRYPATALIELGPPCRRKGETGFWQLCEDYDPDTRDNIINKIIKYDGRITDDTKIGDSSVVEQGQFLTTGRSCFFWSHDHWHDVDQRSLFSNEKKELRYPLIQFSEQGPALLVKVQPWEGKDFELFSDVLYKLKKHAFIRIAIESNELPEIALTADGVDGAEGREHGSFFRIKVGQLAELAVFIYDAKLYIYFPEDNQCFRWALELSESTEA